jgi:hypothetical protein
MLIAGSVDIEAGDELECAVRDLASAGFLSCQGGSVVPTQLALSTEEI